MATKHAQRCIQRFEVLLSKDLPARLGHPLQTQDTKGTKNSDRLVASRSRHSAQDHRKAFIPLPESTLVVLRKYYGTHRNPRFIFPSEGKNHSTAPTAHEPMSESSVQGCITKLVKQLGWTKRGVSTHTLRHCYATHLLEAGINLRLIQKYMGHAYLTSTMVYLHVTTIGEESAITKINSIMKRKS